VSLDFVDIREVWDTVKVGLEYVSEDTSADWRLEDVYAECVRGEAHILMDTARTTTGFIILQSVRIPFQQAAKLLIWIAYDPIENSLATYCKELETLARNTGHKQIEFLSPHKGLWSLAQANGYNLNWAVMNKKL
jgi:hypothetical protein